MELIDKAELLAEIKKIKERIGSNAFLSEYEKGINFGREDVCDDIIYSLNNLEVKARIEESQPTHFATTASDELCKAADEYVHSTLVGSLSIKKNAFKAGANWQLDQMMKTAVIGLVHPDDAEVWVSKRDLANYHEDERVMVIIRKIE